MFVISFLLLACSDSTPEQSRSTTPKPTENTKPTESKNTPKAGLSPKNTAESDKRGDSEGFRCFQTEAKTFVIWPNKDSDMGAEYYGFLSKKSPCTSSSNPKSKGEATSVRFVGQYADKVVVAAQDYFSSVRIYDASSEKELRSFSLEAGKAPVVMKENILRFSGVKAGECTISKNQKNTEQWRKQCLEQAKKNKPELLKGLDFEALDTFDCTPEKFKPCKTMGGAAIGLFLETNLRTMDTKILRAQCETPS